MRKCECYWRGLVRAQSIEIVDVLRVQVEEVLMEERRELGHHEAAHLLGNLLGGGPVLEDEVTGGWHGTHRRDPLVALLEVLLDRVRLLLETVLLLQRRDRE